MIVTCPDCMSRYLVDPRALGVTGRSVRCTQCNHVWMQMPPEDVPRRVDLMPPGTARTPPPAALVRDEIPAYPGEREEPTVVRGGNRSLAIVLIAVVVLGALWYGRDFIVERVPALQPVYAMFGKAAGNPGTDLEFRALTTDRRRENGHATLVIEGQVANVSAAVRRVPPLRITLEDSGKHAIRSWTMVATRDPLAPGESVPFHTSVADPGAGTVGAAVSFDGGTD